MQYLHCTLHDVENHAILSQMISHSFVATFVIIMSQIMPHSLVQTYLTMHGTRLYAPVTQEVVVALVTVPLVLVPLVAVVP